MTSRFKIRKRLNSTRLKAFEKTSWIAGNSSALMESVTQVLNLGTTTACSKFSRELRNRCKKMEKGLFGCKD